MRIIINNAQDVHMAAQLKLFYDENYINSLAAILKQFYPELDKKEFVESIFDHEWAHRELKSRMLHITSVLHKVLPSYYTEALNILRKVVPNMKHVPKHGAYLNMFFPAFVELYGLNQWETSIVALEEFTEYGSSEFAVRPFIIQDVERMMGHMLDWAGHSNYHVRRLASEGCRPRLPWAVSLPEFKKDPSLIIPILELLKDDNEEYVRRSVANNLNDISKDHPDLVISIARDWLGYSIHRDRLVKHACRTLLKASDKEALSLFGFSSSDHIVLQELRLDKEHISIGEEITFSAWFDIKEVGNIRLEYAIDFVKANGKTSRKMFQIKEKDASKGELYINKKHSFRNMTTRKHYSGQHQISIFANGEQLGSVLLTVSA